MKKKNVAMFIDGENVAATFGELIMQIANGVGVINFTKVYGRQKDDSTREWTAFAQTHDMKDIRLSGGPAKNKVDKKLIKDVKKSMNECRGVDIYIIVSGDHGYSTLIKELRSNGKKVIVIGRKNNTSAKLMKAASACFCL